MPEGTILLSAEQKLKSPRHLNPPEEWVRAPEAFEGIYDAEDFLATQEIIAERRRKYLPEEMLKQLDAQAGGTPAPQTAAIAARINAVRSVVPAVTHVDYSPRVQTVDEGRHGRFYRLLRAFEARTGCPVLINTSFNVQGEPIVRTPTEAYRCFMGTDMEALVLEDFVLVKEEQPNSATHSTDEYLSQFELD